MERSNYFISRIKSFSYALKGLKKVTITQVNFQFQLLVAVAVILLSFLLKLSSVEWCIIILCISITLTAECFNTALEFIVDYVCPERHDAAEKIKDIAAAAVLITSIGSAVVGAIIFFPKILKLF